MKTLARIMEPVLMILKITFAIVLPTLQDKTAKVCSYSHSVLNRIILQFSVGAQSLIDCCIGMLFLAM